MNARPRVSNKDKERNRREQEIRRRSLTVLARLHPEEYKRLRVAAQKDIEAERGPLPED
jgi:hypothetical protein